MTISRRKMFGLFAAAPVAAAGLAVVAPARPAVVELLPVSGAVRKKIGEYMNVPIYEVADFGPFNGIGPAFWPAHLEHHPENGDCPYCVIRSGPNGERLVTAYRTIAEAGRKLIA